MSDSIFDKEIEGAIEDLSGTPSSSGEEMTAEMQEQLRQIESLAQMDPGFANSQEYKDLMAALENSSPQA